MLYLVSGRVLIEDIGSAAQHGLDNHAKLADRGDADDGNLAAIREASGKLKLRRLNQRKVKDHDDGGDLLEALQRFGPVRGMHGVETEPCSGFGIQRCRP